MFSRRKDKQPLSTKLLELYNDVANSSLLYMSMEETSRFSELLQGWKSLHTSLLYKLDSLDHEIKTASLTAEEINLLDEIMILKVKCDDNMDRLQLKLDSLYHSGSSTRSPTGTLVSNSTSRVNVPTLRTNNPQPMKYGQSSKKKQMMKSLRSNSTTSKSSTSSKQSAQKAASLSWNSDDKVSNWAPSTSLNAHSKSYSTASLNCQDSTSEFDNFSTFDTKQLSRNETLLVLESTGQVSRQHRGIEQHRNDESLEELTNNLRISKSNPNSLSTVKKPVNNGPYLYKQPQIPRFVINKPKPKEHTRERSITRETRPRPSPSPTKRQPTPRQEEAVDTEADSSEKDTETLDVDSTKIDNEKLIKSLKGVDPLAARQILNEIVVHGDEVHWEDIAGLEAAKNSLKETVVYPFLRPDLFSGLREPARGMLLFGPPGTGKTMLLRAVATESKSTFFSISASSLTSKYLGESEKLVRALFQLAKKLAPSIVFVDEIDSLLSSRNNEGENESSRRIKNEFLVQWSDLTKAAAGRDSGEDLQRVLVLALTNLPWAIDEAARRRFVRRQYIPLPEYETRKAQFTKLLSYQNHTLTLQEFDALVEMTEGYSGSDITLLAKDAAMGPLRLLGDKLLLTSKSEIRPICLQDFEASLKFIKPSVSQDNLIEFEQWLKLFGSSGT